MAKGGHYQARILEEMLVHLDIENAKEISEQVLGFLANQGKKYKPDSKTDAAAFYSPLQLEQIANAIKKGELEVNVNKKNEVSLKGKKLNDIISGVNDLADICLFGRMVANDHTLMLEGAGLFSHALSTHSISNDIDFFSAVDETQQEEEQGAGHIGTLEFNSACYYRYIGLNLDLLEDAAHLAHFSPDERNQVIRTFLNACIMAVPTARKNSMFGHNPPAYILGLKRTGQPLSLINAFESPVKARQDGFITPSIEALETHWEKLRDLYGLEGTPVKLPPDNLDTLIGRLTPEA